MDPKDMSLDELVRKDRGLRGGRRGGRGGQRGGLRRGGDQRGFKQQRGGANYQRPARQGFQGGRGGQRRGGQRNQMMRGGDQRRGGFQQRAPRRPVQGGFRRSQNDQPRRRPFRDQVDRQLPPLRQAPRVRKQIKLQETQASSKLKVRNIDEKQVSNDDLKRLFEKIGKLRACKFDRNEFGQFLGSATVSYERPEDAQKAREEYHGAQLDDKILTVEFVQRAVKVPKVKRGNAIGKGKTLRVGGRR